jgi:hypothetical protein
VDGVELSATEVGAGDGLRVHLTIDPGVSAASRLNLSVTLIRTDGVVCVDENALFEVGTAPLDLELAFERLDLAPGTYAFDVGLYAEDWSATFDYHTGAYGLTVNGAARGKGVLAAPVRWEREGDRWLLGSSMSS